MKAWCSRQRETGAFNKETISTKWRCSEKRWRACVSAREYMNFYMTDKNIHTKKKPFAKRVSISEGRPACLASRSALGCENVRCVVFSLQTERACLHRVHYATLKVVSETIHDEPPEYNSEHKQKGLSARTHGDPQTFTRTALPSFYLHRHKLNSSIH